MEATGEPPEVSGTTDPVAIPNPDAPQSPSSGAKPQNELAVTRWATAVVAAFVFLLFAALVVSFRGFVAVDAPDLGVSMAVDHEATEARLKPVVDGLLNQKAIVGWLARSNGNWRIKSGAKPPDDPPRIGEALDDIAESLASDESRAALVSAWAGELSAVEQQRKLRLRSRDYIQAVARSEAADRVTKDSTARDAKTPDAVLAEMAAQYDEARKKAAERWASLVLPTIAVEAFLSGQDVVGVPKPAANPASAGRTRKQPTKDVENREVAPPAPVSSADVPPDFPTHLQGAVVRFVTAAVLDEAIARAIKADLQYSTAHRAVVKAVERDFSGRWMWIISAAVFITAAVSAVLGGAWTVWVLGEHGSRTPLMIAVGAFVGAGLAYGLFVRGSLPVFLTAPLWEFGALYELDGYLMARLMNVATATAVGALLVPAWASFLLPTRDAPHLDAQFAALRWSFHTATFVLVAGVLHLYAYLQWPSSFMGEAPAVLVQSGARVSALALGAAFSTLLLLIYVPGAKVLVEEARALQATLVEGKRGAIDQMLTRHGFDASPTQQIVRFAQLFAPLLIAPLGAEVISLLAQ